MSDTSHPDSVDVLHVRPEAPRGESTDKFEALLSASSLRVDRCGDVYRGLARLCRMEPCHSHVVIVCVDELSAAEMEFFSIAARMRCRRKLEVYVYGSPHASDRVGRAIDLGAAGRADEALIRSLTESAASDRRAATSGPEAGATVVEPASVATAAFEPRPPDRRAPQSEAGKPPDNQPFTGSGCEGDSSDREMEAGSGARVPWLRYDDRPVRTGPGAGDRSAAAAGCLGPVARSSAGSEPLLTDEELQALFGDDIPMIAPGEEGADGA